MAEQPELSICIANWNCREQLRHCLKSIQIAKQDLKCEVVVVDNASGDGSPEMVAADFSWVALIKNPKNYGFARANNQAAAHSHGKYLFFLNNDTVVGPESLTKIVAFMNAHPGVGMAGPRLIGLDGKAQRLLSETAHAWFLLSSPGHLALDHAVPRCLPTLPARKVRSEPGVRSGVVDGGGYVPAAPTLRTARGMGRRLPVWHRRSRSERPRRAYAFAGLPSRRRHRTLGPNQLREPTRASAISATSAAMPAISANTWPGQSAAFSTSCWFVPIFLLHSGLKSFGKGSPAVRN